MTKATINPEHFQGYKMTATFASSNGNGSHKSIMVQSPVDNVSETVIVVLDRERVIYEGTSLEDAAAAYNEAP